VKDRLFHEWRQMILFDGNFDGFFCVFCLKIKRKGFKEVDYEKD